jgi:hypothetical protein
MDTKLAAQERFESAREGLIELSHRIHAHPELGFEEEKSSVWLCEALTDAGFDVQKGICDLPTAFRARAGSGPLHVGICAEYDSLPGIGHACGHNIIAASAVGAALPLDGVRDRDARSHLISEEIHGVCRVVPPRPDQALLGWRRGQVKNKSNDPAAYHQSEASKDGFGSQSQFVFKLLKNKEFMVPGRGTEFDDK